MPCLARQRALTCGSPFRLCARRVRDLFAESANPLALVSHSFEQKGDDFRTPFRTIECGDALLQRREPAFPGSQVAVAGGENLGARFRSEDGKQARAYQELRGRGRFPVTELAEAAQKFLMAARRKGINGARLAALTGFAAAADPSLADKLLEERIKQVVVQVAGTRDQPGNL